jgi:hypothetical protein
MPVFSAAAAFIVAEVIGIGGAAILGSAGLAFVTSVVAVGLAAVTSRLINGSGAAGSGGGTQQDPGVRVQFPPATNNKVPVVYGSVYQKGVITDARISNGNQTMTYVLVLSEKTQTGTFTVGDIYWNDQKLIFKTDVAAGEPQPDGEGGYTPGTPAVKQSHIVASSIDQNGQGSSNSNFDGLVRMRVYSGSTTSTNQIFPLPSTGNIEDARTILGEADTNYQLSGLVFAVIQIDYSSAKGVTGLGQVTFQLNNTLKNPGLVWYDYMTSTRYGVGIPPAQINTTTSIDSSNSTSLYSISEQIPPNQYLAGGTTATNQVRYEINGVLSPGATVKNNLDRICLSSAAWTTFDYSQGKWKVLPNRPATSGELASAFVFNDDNVIGDIAITTTNLEDLYNILETEYASRKIRDQNDYFKGTIDPTLRNDLEPDNVLNMRLDMVNNAIHAARIGLIELKQSRIDQIISFRADFSALQCQAGDVVKLTNSIYGFNEKLFRITKVREVEDNEGGITIEITALEYNADVYADETLEDSAATPGSGIPSFGGSGTLLAPSAPVVGNVNTSTNPSFTLSTTINGASGPVDEIQWFYSTTSNGTFAYLANEYSVSGTYAAGQIITDTITTLPGGTYYFRARTGLGAHYGDLSSTSTEFVWAPSFNFGSP